MDELDHEIAQFLDENGDLNPETRELKSDGLGKPAILPNVSSVSLYDQMIKSYEADLAKEEEDSKTWLSGDKRFEVIINYKNLIAEAKLKRVDLLASQMRIPKRNGGGKSVPKPGMSPKFEMRDDGELSGAMDSVIEWMGTHDVPQHYHFTMLQRIVRKSSSRKDIENWLKGRQEDG